MDGLEMCARDLSHTLLECQRLEAENEKLRKLLRKCKTPVKDYYRKYDGEWDLTSHDFHDYDEKKLEKYKKLYKEINSILQNQQI